MLRILYCDDEPAQEIYLKRAVQKWEETGRDTVRLQTFRSAEEVLFELDQTIPYDLRLLDIQMKQMNGMELAHEIRKRDRNVAIAFLTNDPGFVFEGYDVEAVGYMMKPVDPAQLASLLDRIAEKKGQEKRYLIFRYSGEDYRLEEQEIVYLESDGHYIRIHGTEGSYDVKEKFQNMIDVLEGDGWIRPHRSYFVNLGYVEKLPVPSCVMENGERIPVSRGRYREVNEAFIDYYKNRMGV